MRAGAHSSIGVQRPATKQNSGRNTERNTENCCLQTRNYKYKYQSNHTIMSVSCRHVCYQLINQWRKREKRTITKLHLEQQNVEVCMHKSVCVVLCDNVCGFSTMMIATTTPTTTTTTRRREFKSSQGRPLGRRLIRGREGRLE